MFCTAMTVMHVCRVWTEECGETRRPTDQTKRITERQERCFKHLALRDRSATRHITNLWFGEGRLVLLLTEDYTNV